MNKLQLLGVVFAKVNECSLELSCVRYCDPNLLLTKRKEFLHNAFVCKYLCDSLLSELQHFSCTNGLTACKHLAIILENLCEHFYVINKALCSFEIHKDHQQYYRTLFDVDQCSLHDPIKISFVNKQDLEITLTDFNEIERFLCKLNLIFPLIDARSGMRIISQIYDRLRKFTGISPLARLEFYKSACGGCYLCYEELQMTPNNGSSVQKRLNGVLCEHVTYTKDLVFQENEYLEVLREDLKRDNLLREDMRTELDDMKKILSNKKERGFYVPEAEQLLHRYDVFTDDIPNYIYTLSDLTYWSKTSEKIIKTMNMTMQQLNVYNNNMIKLKRSISRALNDIEVRDCFDVFEKVVDKRHCMFLGSMFTSSAKIISLLATQCLTAFEEKAVFERLNECDALCSTVNTILERLKSASGDGKEGITKQDFQADELIKGYNVSDEVSVRKKTYLNKVADKGYSKIVASLSTEERSIKKLIDINFLGTLCIDMMVKLEKMFYKRSQICQMVENGVHLLALCNYDNHLYIRNNLSRQSISTENVNGVIQHILSFLCGPIFTHRHDIFPMPPNIDMAYACDNANVLPHRKEELMQCVNDITSVHGWSISSYNTFFKIDSVDLNTAHAHVWGYVKEFIVAVTLYNELYGQRLRAFRVDENTIRECGLYLTYNSDIPLVLKTDKNVIYGSDIYSILYAHMHHA
ncbi:terminase subunit 2 [Elephant endotheliotropic herpesvirus 1A]|uniref:Terminase subunit 2 n=2 Tax=Elephantid herpesvirus 1 TaxID=146015 RepID=A0A866VU29_ELHV1|nr:DNA packaging terminase subunit 2 [Elephantid betaherpesvirus 1]QOE74577.1 terminase subunit 2 [Elephant endotheliotropic herpesvirus 1A]AGE10029.1 DNA packaging terminase subunit 2 [Elephantid betaherpesvirus 1]QOE74694.1 terminase subunit 2 [Elephant endotheliotropic herpesvirus 1A]QOE74814.1 terminase subunit 2 [Elephant endotheliotropic herpesvirus 1A]QOE74930.1 terminase subunit 2 [Elephant endotheliotropic herpesvirus 1A]